MNIQNDFLILLLFFIIFLSKFSNSSKQIINGTIYFDKLTQNLAFKQGIYDEKLGLTFGILEDSPDKGWSKLIVKTNPNAFDNSLKWYEKDRILSYGVGMLEGYLTNSKISDHFKNMYHNVWYSSPNRKMLPKIREYFLMQKQWIEEMIKKNEGDYYYEHVANIHQQYLGLLQGLESYFSIILFFQQNSILF